MSRRCRTHEMRVTYNEPRDAEFRRLWALLAARAKQAGITPQDVHREVHAAHADRGTRAGRTVPRSPKAGSRTPSRKPV